MASANLRGQSCSGSSWVHVIQVGFGCGGRRLLNVQRRLNQLGTCGPPSGLCRSFRLSPSAARGSCRFLVVGATAERLVSPDRPRALDHRGIRVRCMCRSHGKASFSCKEWGLAGAPPARPARCLPACDYPWRRRRRGHQRRHGPPPPDNHEHLSTIDWSGKLHFDQRCPGAAVDSCFILVSVADAESTAACR